MKVIDLLNKIANGEEVPKKILYDGKEYSYVERNRMFAKYIREPFNARLPDYLFTDIVNIEDEVEIIEEHKEEPQEHKIPEKLDKYADVSGDLAYEWSFAEKKLKDKINEILDYLEEIK